MISLTCSQCINSSYKTGVIECLVGECAFTAMKNKKCAHYKDRYPVAVMTDKTFHEWISVDDDLPKENCDVLASDGISFDRCYFYKGKCFGLWGNYTEAIKLYKITHWMHIKLPEVKL